MDLANQFHVSQTPIEYALKQLSERGLVNDNARKGYYVVKLTPKDIEEIYQLRRLFEGSALRTGRLDLLKVEKIKKEMEFLLEEGEQEEKRTMFCELDYRLHSFLVQSSDNKRLREFFFQIYDLVMLCIGIGGQIDKFTQEHIAMLNAILQGSLEEASRILDHHLCAGEEEVKGAVKAPTGS